MSNFLEKIIYLTENQYQTLITNNQVNNNYLYITDDDGISLDDLNQTIINVAHGGTGKNTLLSGQVLVGNGTNPITSIVKTNTNTANTLVERDESGNFSAGTITATLSGNATTANTATNLANNPSIQASTSNTNQVTITAGGKTSSAYTIPYATSAGSATSAGKITNLGTGDQASSTETWRRVWISYADNVTGRPAWTDNLVFQTSTNTLKTTKFQGALIGNADTATSAGKWTTARTLTIGNTGKSVDGSGNVSWSLTEIGAAASGHDHSGTYVPNTTGANDVNTLVNTGIYNITSGSATNTPKGYGFGQLLVMAYRKHIGNTTTDWASQIYLHNGGGTASGSATAPGNVLYYRTSNNSSSNTWFDWQKAVHATAAYSKVGDTNKPVYIAEDGTATAISYTIAKSVPANAVFTDTNKYHKTGSWSGLTYTASAVNDADELKFTIPTGNSATTVAVGNHTHSYNDLTDKINEDIFVKKRALSISTDVELVKLLPGMYDHTSNMNNTLPTGYGTILNIHGNYKYGSLIAAETNNVMYYRIYYYDTDDSWQWRGEWQTIAHADQSASNIGSATQPVYMTATGVITAGTALKDLAYISKGSGTTKFLREDGTWQTALTSHQSLAAYAPLASPSLTGTPTAPTAANGTSTTQIATTEFVNNTLSYVNAMRFKGTLGTGGTVTALPASHEAGDTYRVITAGTYPIVDSNGRYCEIGTLIICTADGTAANATHWTAVETNEDGAVIGPSTATNGGIVLFDGATGRIIQDSSKTLTTTAPTSSSDDSTIPTSKAIWTTVNTAITELDVTAVGGGTGEYVSKISETDGKINATISTTSVSNTWTAGTTAGPKLDTTVNGITGTAVAIPSASFTASGVVTTANQTFSGEKTFSSSTHFQNIYHYNGNSIQDGSWVTGANGVAPTVSGSSYTGSVIGTSILTLGNNIIGGNSASGANNNAQGFLRLYSSGSAYAQITAYSGDKTRLYPEEGISIPTDKVGIMFRPTSGSYYTHFSYQTGNNEALVMATQNAVTSFIFINGESYANISSTRWRSLTPALQIKNNSVIIGKLIDTNVTPDYKLEVNGTSYLNGNTTINGNLIPGENNTKILGSTDAKWAKLYVGTEATYGDSYTPIYWHNGVPTVVTLTQQCEFTINSGNSGVKLTHAAITKDSYVTQIVIDDGEENLNSAISWQSYDGANTGDPGYIELTCSKVSGNVSGYIMISRGDKITATPTDIT